MENEMMPLIEKLGDKAREFRVKKAPYGDEPFYLYKHDRHYLALSETGEAWVYSPDGDKYIPSDWQTELNRFAASLDYDLHPCGQPGCNCGNKAEEMAIKRAPWEAEIVAARKANAERYSDEHHEAEWNYFLRKVQEETGKPTLGMKGDYKEIARALKALGVREGRAEWNPTQKGPAN